MQEDLQLVQAEKHSGDDFAENAHVQAKRLSTPRAADLADHRTLSDAILHASQPGQLSRMVAENPPEVPTLQCASCGGKSFFADPLADPKTGLTYRLSRCRDCGNIRWPEPVK